METWEEFQAALTEHPDWRGRLRAEILDEQFMQLPALVRQNSEDIRGLQEIGRQLLEESRRARTDIGANQGKLLELWHRDHPESLALGRIRRIRSIGVRDLVDLTELVEDGTLLEAQALALAHIDLLVAGREGKGDEARDAYLVCEISQTIDDHDVTRAAERAGLLRTLGFNARGLAVGEVAPEQVVMLAKELGVGTVTRARS